MDNHRQDQMVAFIIELFEMYWPDCSDIDGGDLQSLGICHGILTETVHYKPCGEQCNCASLCNAEDWRSGVSCFRLSDWVLPLRGEVLVKETTMTPEQVIDIAVKLLLNQFDFDAEEAEKFAQLMKIALGGG